MTIREEIPRFLRRMSDLVQLGRNNARLVIGTDRKDVVASGYGEGSENASINAGAIDIVTGYTEENMNFNDDLNRIYLSSKSNPDEYLNMQLGSAQEGVPAILVRTDNLYIKVRQFIKIKNENVSILIDPDGNLTIEASETTTVKSGASTLQMNSDGTINIGSENGQGNRIITEQDVCVGIDPTTGSAIQSRFVVGPGVDHPLGGKVNNQNVKVVK